MKILKQITVWVFSIALVVSCNEGIDPISPAEPGNDVEDPTITINFPAPGGVVKITEGGAVKVDLVAEDPPGDNVLTRDLISV